MSLTGEPEAPPTRFGLSMVGFMTGVTTSMGLLAALLGAARTNLGCDVDVSLFDVALHQLSYPATWFLNEGHVTERMPRSAHPSTVPCQLYTTADGWVFMMAMTPKFWEVLVAGAGLPELIKDARFVDAKARRENREALTRILDEALSTQTTAYWLDLFKGKMPLAPVYNLNQALTNPYVQQVGMIQSLPHKNRPDFKVLANPIKINGQRLAGEGCSALGADTQAIVNQLAKS